MSRLAHKRPFVFMNVASTADGKIAFANHRFVPFGSARDRALLLELRSQADAVMCGARTVDLFPVTMGPGGPRYRRKRVARGLAEYNIRVIVSGTASVDPRAEIFKHDFSPIVLLTTARASAARLRRLERAGAVIEICGEQHLDFGEALRRLRHRWKVNRLLCEGGGAVNGALLQAGLVDEIHLTLCPLVLGGQSAPTLADGLEAAKLSQAIPLEMKSRRRVGDELFLVYKVRGASKRSAAKTRAPLDKIEPSGRSA